MRPFKFLQDNDYDDDIEVHEGASWVFGRREYVDPNRYEIVEEYHYGIHSLLNHYPSHYIVTILNITGPNGIIHDIDNEGTGWGFDITSDLIRIEWLRFLP